MSETDRSALELQALHRVIASGTRALDLDVVLDRCLEQTLAVSRGDAGLIYFADESRFATSSTPTSGPCGPLRT